MMKAMILAAGRGERMRPLTDSLPKPLLPLAAKPLIVYHIEALARAGITDIVINHAWLGHLLEQQLADGRQFGVHLQYSAEGTTGLETAGGIRLALPLLGNEPFLVVNGDIHTDFDFGSLLAQPMADVLAHLVLVPNPPQHPAGDFALAADSGLVAASGAIQHTFSGIGVYRPEFFNAVPAGPQKLAPFLRHAMQSALVSGQLYQGYWADIGTPERLALAEQWQLQSERGQYVG
jgi:MurNAc alpha-1-phosphate uridylyltransferase